MIRNSYLSVHGPLPGPLLESWVQRREFIYVVPDSSEDRRDYLLGGALVRHEVEVVSIDASIFHHGAAAAGLDPAGIEAGDCCSEPLLGVGVKYGVDEYWQSSFQRDL